MTSDDQPRTPSTPPVGYDPRAILNSIGEATYDWDILGDRLAWSPNVCDVLALGRRDLIETGALWHAMLAPESPSSPHAVVTRSDASDLGTGVPYHVTYALVLEPGDRAPRTWIEDTGRWFAGPDQRPARAHGVIRVVADRAVSGRAMGSDILTGAQTRLQFLECAARMYTHAGRTKTSFGLLMIGIDNLAAINRAHGFAVADEAIVAIADRLRAIMRTTDGLARYSAGKFALLLDSCGPDQLEPAVQRFLNQMSNRPIETSAGRIDIDLHVGAVCGPRHARNPQLLLQNAEEALRCAREARTPPYRIYDPGQARDDVRLRLRRTRDVIVSALNDRRIEIALEPIVSASSGQPIFFEALMRLRLENGELVSPGAVIPVAERLGLIEMLDQRVLELAVARLASEPNLSLTVNMSAVTLHAAGMIARLAAQVAGRAGIAARLMLEITETCAIADIEATGDLLREIKALGIRIAMDDFGSGHTSFRNLRGLDIDLLKIDGAFVQNLARSSDDRFFVRTLIKLAQHLEIPVVAEWVQDAETAALLAEWGVQYFQGDFFGRAEHATVETLLLTSGAAA
jgi:diguanylate cyclase (GGDEF)-like protein